MTADLRELASQKWYGYGRWDAPYWFVGMEPGGDDDLESYADWKKLGGTELIDCRAHHLASTNPKWTRWHLKERPPTQPTWRRLIQMLLAYKGLEADLDAVRLYQRNEWGSVEGETALVEVSALHSPRLSGVDLDGDVIQGRLKALRRHLQSEKPEIAVFYGLRYQRAYERVTGELFDDSDGFAWCGPTLCALIPGPTSHLKGKLTPWAKADYWIAKGRTMRAMADARSRGA